MERCWAWVRLVGGAAILAALVWHLGVDPFVDGVRMVDGRAVVIAVVIGAVTTAACAWRWRLVARSLGVRVSLRAAVGAYYRSLFLNAILPGGVAGDVHRAVRHGRDIGDVALGVRAVVVERVAGLGVTLGLGVAALAVLPSPVQPNLPLLAGVLVAVAALLVLVRAAGRGRSARWVRTLRAVRAYMRDGVPNGSTAVGVVVATAVILGGNLATFVVAARVAGVSAPTVLLVPLTLLSLLAMVLPLSIAGWGPREGVAAAAFAAAGLTASQGLAAAVVYGVLTLAATLPGAAVLVVGWIVRQRRVRAGAGLWAAPEYGRG